MEFLAELSGSAQGVDSNKRVATAYSRNWIGMRNGTCNGRSWSFASGVSQTMTSTKLNMTRTGKRSPRCKLRLGAGMWISAS